MSLPAPLREATGGAACVAVEGATVAEALEALAQRYPGLRRHLYDDRGGLRRYVNLYLNDEDVRSLARGAETRIETGDTITIVPGIAGGSTREGA